MAGKLKSKMNLIKEQVQSTANFQKNNIFLPSSSQICIPNQSKVDSREQGFFYGFFEVAKVAIIQKII